MGRRNQGNISLFTRRERQNQGNSPCSKTWFVSKIILVLSYNIVLDIFTIIVFGSSFPSVGASICVTLPTRIHLET
jgi:hypothetical protein